MKELKVGDFISVPEDLLHVTMTYGDWLGSKGWSLDLEPYDLAHPRTPFFVASRSSTRQYIEVQSSLDMPLIRQWCRYALTLKTDSRIVVVLSSGMPSEEDVADLKKLGVGLVLGEGMVDLLPSRDLALSVALPDLPEQLTVVLGEAYDLFDRGDWREGFESACIVVEQEAREYLVRHIQRGRVTFVTETGEAETYTNAGIRRMTMGRLALAFRQIATPNAADSRIAAGLANLNDDRVTVAHYRGKGRQREKKLRENVGQHMFRALGTLRQLKGIAD